MVSRVRPIGASNGTPWNPSMTCGPEVPMPSSNRPSETSSRPAAVIASSVGVRLYSCRMPDAMCARVVRAAI